MIVSLADWPAGEADLRARLAAFRKAKADHALTMDVPAPRDHELIERIQTISEVTGADFVFVDPADRSAELAIIARNEADAAAHEIATRADDFAQHEAVRLAMIASQADLAANDPSRAPSMLATAWDYTVNAAKTVLSIFTGKP